MPTARVSELDIAYEQIGTGEPLLLVQGFGAQMLLWPDELCEMLAARGFGVIRYDNRDAGLSTRFNHLRTPPVGAAIARFLVGVPARAPYSLVDMARDGIGLLDALGIERAHVWGVSMGGLIAQRMAIHHPHRLRSLALMMTWSGSRLDGVPHPRAVRALLRPPARSREENARLLVETFRALSGSIPNDEEQLYELGLRLWDRSPVPAGADRHLLAVLAGGNQQRALTRVRVPTVVLHGAEDPLIPATGGRAIARCIPDASLRVFPGMGHQLPRVLWPTFVDEVVAVAQRGGFPAAA